VLHAFSGIKFSSSDGEIKLMILQLFADQAHGEPESFGLEMTTSLPFSRRACRLGPFFSATFVVSVVNS